MVTVKSLAEGAKVASRQTALLTSAQKNDLIFKIADALESNIDMILSENQLDLDTAEQNGVRPAMIDRLRLTEARIRDMANGAREVSKLPDPIGEVLEERVLTSGVKLMKKRVPLGVIGIIFEARPNVTLDASVLCLKSGNATVLRGLLAMCVHPSCVNLRNLASLVPLFFVLFQKSPRCRSCFPSAPRLPSLPDPAPVRANRQ